MDKVFNTTEILNEFDVLAENFTVVSDSKDVITTYLDELLLKLFANKKIATLLSSLILLSSAIVIITLGSIASLGPLEIMKIIKTEEAGGDLEEEQEQKDDYNWYIDGYKNKPFNLKDDGLNKIDSKYALTMPVFCGIGLVGMYFLIKNISAETINKSLNIYVLIMSSFSVYSVLIFFYEFLSNYLVSRSIVDAKSLLPRYRLTLSDDSNNTETYDMILNPHYKVPGKPGRGKDAYPFKECYKRTPPKPSTLFPEDQSIIWFFSAFDIIAIISSIIFAIYFYFNQLNLNWVVKNFVAFSFAFNGIQKLKINSFFAGFIVLTGLFFYDIYFVFNSDIMITVATNLKIPVLLTSPSGITEKVIDGQNKSTLAFSLLGLGDIVIPGIFIAFCLRFDSFKYYYLNQSLKYNKFDLTFDKTYFITAIISYLVALILCFIALHLSEHAQPALLYISPCLILGVIIRAYFGNELNLIWNYNEDPSSTEKEVKFLEAEFNDEDEDLEYTPKEDHEEEDDDVYEEDDHEGTDSDLELIDDNESE